MVSLLDTDGKDSIIPIIIPIKLDCLETTLLENFNYLLEMRVMNY